MRWAAKTFGRLEGDIERAVRGENREHGLDFCEALSLRSGAVLQAEEPRMEIPGVVTRERYSKIYGRVQPDLPDGSTTRT